MDDSKEKCVENKSYNCIHPLPYDNSDLKNDSDCELSSDGNLMRYLVLVSEFLRGKRCLKCGNDEKSDDKDEDVTVGVSFDNIGDRSMISNFGNNNTDTNNNQTNIGNCYDYSREKKLENGGEREYEHEISSGLEWGTNSRENDNLKSVGCNSDAKNQIYHRKKNKDDDDDSTTIINAENKKNNQSSSEMFPSVLPVDLECSSHILKPYTDCLICSLDPSERSISAIVGVIGEYICSN
jgi:hypothetical protein